MTVFDHDYVEEIVKRLGSIAPGARPAWGSLTAPRMIGHLASTVRFSMGGKTSLPDRSTWFRRNCMKPLVLNGIVPLGKNVRLPIAKEQFDKMFPECDVETLHAVLEDYLAAVHTGDIVAPPHPFFGELSIDGWAKLHCRHFEHHMKQFGV